MQQNLTDETKRRLALRLAPAPLHLNSRHHGRRRGHCRRRQEDAAAVLLILWLAGWFAAIAWHVTR